MLIQSKTESIGDISISNEVLEVISSIAVLETEGVHSLNNNRASGSGSIEKLGKKYRARGIRVEDVEGNLKISAYVNLNNDRNVHKIAETIQDNIKAAVSNMLEIKISEINIHIVNIIK